MVNYYRDMWPRRSHVLSPPTDSNSVCKGRNILWNDALEDSLKELKRMISAEMLLSYPDWTIPFTVHIGDYDK